MTDDVGAVVRLRVTVTNPDGSATATSTPTATVTSAPPVNTARPAITGTVQRGAILTAGQGTWTGNGNTYAYQWQRDGANIPDATGSTYTLAPDDVGKAIRVVVTGSNPDGFEAAASTATATVPSAAPVNTVAARGHRQRAARLHAHRRRRAPGPASATRSRTSGSPRRTARRGRRSRMRRA